MAVDVAFFASGVHPSYFSPIKVIRMDNGSYIVNFGEIHFCEGKNIKELCMAIRSFFRRFDCDRSALIKKILYLENEINSITPDEI
jgi:hypothetical protein